MHGAIHVGLELLHGEPYRQIDEDKGIIEDTRFRRIPRGGLIPPNESWASVGEGIDLVQGGYELGHYGVVTWTEHLRNVHLCEVVVHQMARKYNLLLCIVMR
jgi:hypothetical protein